MELIWSREALESLLEHPSQNVQRWAVGRVLDLYPDLSDRVIALLPSASGSTASFILDSLCDHHVHITDPGPLLETIETFDRQDIGAASTALLLRSGHTPPGYDPGTVELGSSASILTDTEAGFNHLLQLYHRSEEDNSSVLHALSQACGFDEVFDELADAEEEKNIREILEYRGDVWGCDLSDLEGVLEDGTALDILDGALTRTVPTDGEPWKRGILAELEEDRTRIESIRDVAT